MKGLRRNKALRSCQITPDHNWQDPVAPPDDQDVSWWMTRKPEVEQFVVKLTENALPGPRKSRIFDLDDSPRSRRKPAIPYATKRSGSLLALIGKNRNSSRSQEESGDWRSIWF